MPLGTDGNKKEVQCFVLCKGYINMTTLDIAQCDEIIALHCSESGTIEITWNDESTDEVVCNLGEDYMFGDDALFVTINSGTFQGMV